MPPRKSEETYYDILKVDPRATVAEIVAAYHSARNAFSRDSVATYSLFSPEETQGILAKLDEAYQTLSNMEKKADYDKQLSQKGDNAGVPPTMTELELKQAAQLLPKDPGPADNQGGNINETIPAPMPSFESMNGTVLKEIRERRSMSLDDVSRITKIPTKFIKSIEDENAKALPARVYLQGFVKNLATLYKMDPATTVKSYLEHVDKKDS